MYCHVTHCIVFYVFYDSTVDVLVFKVMHDSMERENKPVVAEDGSITTIYSAWPRLQAHYYLMLSNPRLSAYISSEKFYPFPGRCTCHINCMQDYCSQYIPHILRLLFISICNALMSMERLSEPFVMHIPHK